MKTYKDVGLKNLRGPRDFRRNYYGPTLCLASPQVWSQARSENKRRMPLLIGAFFPKQRFELEEITKPSESWGWELEPIERTERYISRATDASSLVFGDPLPDGLTGSKSAFGVDQVHLRPNLQVRSSVVHAAMPQNNSVSNTDAERHIKRARPISSTTIVATQNKADIPKHHELVTWNPLGMKRIAWAVREHIFPALKELVSHWLWHARRQASGFDKVSNRWSGVAHVALGRHRGIILAFGSGVGCCVIGLVFMNNAYSSYSIQSRNQASAIVTNHPVAAQVRPALLSKPEVAHIASPAKVDAPVVQSHRSDAQSNNLPIAAIGTAHVVEAPKNDSRAAETAIASQSPSVVKGASKDLSEASTYPSAEDLASSARTTVTVIAPSPANLSDAENDNLDIRSPTSIWYTAGERYGVDPLLLYAVALVETRTTGSDGQVSPTPWVVRIDGDIVSGSQTDVVNALSDARAGNASIQDVGIMQVYWPWHKDIAPDPVKLLSPASNINTGAQILRDALQESADSVVAIGFYHSHDRQKARYYGQAVMTVYHRLQHVLNRVQPVDLASTGASGGLRQE